MKVNFAQELKTLDGRSIKYADRGQMYLKDATLDALLATFQDEQNLPGEEKAKRYVLATRIYSNPEKLELKAEEVALIKKQIGRLFGPLVVGQAFAMLDGKEKE